jgi:hypothetical protein
MTTLSLSELSPHLFWDVDKNKLSFEEHKLFIIQRILEFGVLKDWLLLRKSMSIEEIATVTKNLRSLDDISLNFIAKLSGTAKENFRCYITKPSQKKLWPY